MALSYYQRDFLIDVISGLFLFGFIILVGYFSLKFFEHFKIPDILLLVFFGLLIGPLYNVFGSSSIAAFRAIMPFVSAMALIIILFEAGYSLNIFRILKSLGIAAIFTVLVSGFTVIAVAAIAFFVFGWSLLVSILLGIIVGGTDSAVVMSLIGKTSASEDAKMIVALETALNDALIVFAFAVAGIIKAGEFSIQVVGQQVLGAFSISAVIGFIAALFWLKLLQHGYRDKKYDYLLTISALSILFAFVEFFHANGAVAAFVFGIVLGNAKDITLMLRLAPKQMDSNILLFQQELSFFVRTFFFVYLGVIFEKNALTQQIIIMALLLMAAIVLARYAVTKIIAHAKPAIKKDSQLIFVSLPRGISAAVLASIPLSLGLGETGNTIFYLTFLVILLSNAFTTIGIFAFEKNKTKKENNPENVQELKV